MYDILNDNKYCHMFEYSDKCLIKCCDKDKECNKKTVELVSSSTNLSRKDSKKGKRRSVI